MIKINLEKELIKQNRSVVTARELLLIQESERLAKVINTDSLYRVFGETAAHSGAEIKNRVSGDLEDTKQYDQSRVFHISQIEKLCKKYHLKFLPSILFKGAIDPETVNKISMFEVANNVTIPSWTNSGYRRNVYYVDGRTFIAAPAHSFQLEEKPKDPILFYEINKNYFYLIHKWGSDISLFRRSLSFLSKAWVSVFLSILPAIIIGILLLRYCTLTKEMPDGGMKVHGWFFLFITLCVYAFFQIAWFLISGSPAVRFVKKNEWRSHYKD